MIVVADTGPLNYLVQIEADGLLTSLYRQVIVPTVLTRGVETAQHKGEGPKTFP